jgi:integrase/recombinase XerD
MTTSLETTFSQDYQIFEKHLKLKGLQESSIDGYSRGLRRVSRYFDFHFHIHDLTEQQMVDYFVDLIKLPRVQKIPNILTVEQAANLFISTRVASYWVFYFTVYSLGLRISEGISLEVGDIDADRM